MYLMDTKDYKFFKEYPNQTQASKELSISTSVIKNARIFGLLVNDAYYFCTIKNDSYTKARSIYIENRHVYQYDGNTKEFIKEYDHQFEAELDYPNSNINKSIKTKSVCKSGYFWGLEKLEKYGVSTKNKKRLVGKYDLNENLLKIYNSATEAAKENGTSVWKVLNGTNKTQKGCIFKYLS